MSEPIKHSVELKSGVSIPWLGFGLYNIAEGQAVETAVGAALDAGYRAFDAATLYGNEASVGQALSRSGVARKELFITSKVWNGEQGYAETRAAFARALERLKLDYIDLYLLHWPVPGKFIESWKALEELHAEGLIRAIGVSNFEASQLDALLKVAQVKPVLNQVELHPHLAQFELHEYSKKHGIQLAAWSPLKHGKILQDETLVELANKYGKDPAQIILRWLFQRGVIAIPKAANPEHIRSNAQLGDFALEAADIDAINALDQNGRIGPHPKKVDYSSDDEFIRTFQGWEEPAAALA